MKKILKNILVIAALSLALPVYAIVYTGNSDWTQPFLSDAYTMGLWHFDETTGDSTVTDASGNNPDGVMWHGLSDTLTWQTSAVPYSGFGNMAHCYWFSNDNCNYGAIKIDCPDATSEDPLFVGPDQDFTIEFWAKPQYVNYRFVVDKSLNDYHVEWYEISPYNLNAGWYGIGGWENVTSTLTPVTGEWHHYR